MPQHTKENILAGRTAVDAYREDHVKLYSKPWHRGIPEEHTPLLNGLSAKLKERGFDSLDQFFDDSEELNMQELGYKDRQDFEGKAIDADREALERMWQ